MLDYLVVNDDAIAFQMICLFVLLLVAAGTYHALDWINSRRR